MALNIHYIGNSAWRQNKPPAWSKSFAGEMDTCTLQWQGAQYLEKAFLDSLTAYQALVYLNEAGVTVTDTAMRLIKASSDDNPIWPTVTLSFDGFRNGAVSDAVATDGRTSQSASTTHTITDDSSVNYGKAITMSIQYYANRTAYEWTQLSNPSGTPTYGTVRNPLSYSGPYGDPNIFYRKFSGQVDDDGQPASQIPIGDATAVWNTFSGTTQISDFTSKELVPGYVWQCSATAEFLLVGS